MGVIHADIFGVVVLVVRDHLEAILAFLLQTLHVQHLVVGEEVDTVSVEFPDRDVHEQRVAVFDRWRHRLTPPGYHLQVKVFFEGESEVA